MRLPSLTTAAAPTPSHLNTTTARNIYNRTFCATDSTLILSNISTMGIFKRTRKKLKKLIGCKARIISLLGRSERKPLDPVDSPPRGATIEASDGSITSSTKATSTNNDPPYNLVASDAVGCDDVGIQANILDAPLLPQRPFSPKPYSIANGAHCRVYLTSTTSSHYEIPPNLRSETADLSTPTLQRKLQTKKPVMSEAAARVLGPQPDAYTTYTKHQIREVYD
ncbi:hypothetical protein HDK77DRAFT_479377 [Phyllosticta capitalensis]